MLESILLAVLQFNIECGKKVFNICVNATSSNSNKIQFVSISLIVVSGFAIHLFFYD